MSSLNRSTTKQIINQVTVIVDSLDNLIDNPRPDGREVLAECLSSAIELMKRTPQDPGPPITSRQEEQLRHLLYEIQVKTSTLYPEVMIMSYLQHLETSLAQLLVNQQEKIGQDEEALLKQQNKFRVFGGSVSLAQSLVTEILQGAPQKSAFYFELLERVWSQWKKNWSEILKKRKKKNIWEKTETAFMEQQPPLKNISLVETFPLVFTQFDLTKIKDKLQTQDELHFRHHFADIKREDLKGVQRQFLKEIRECDQYSQMTDLSSGSEHEGLKEEDKEILDQEAKVKLESGEHPIKLEKGEPSKKTREDLISAPPKFILLPEPPTDEEKIKKH